jgi:hypothetical protein
MEIGILKSESKMGMISIDRVQISENSRFGVPISDFPRADARGAWIHHQAWDNSC